MAPLAAGSGRKTFKRLGPRLAVGTYGSVASSDIPMMPVAVAKQDWLLPVGEDIEAFQFSPLHGRSR